MGDRRRRGAGGACVPACRPPWPWPSGRRTRPWCGTRSRLPPRTPFPSSSSSSSSPSVGSNRKLLLWIKVSYEGWIARLRWWPHSGRVHAAFIGRSDWGMGRWRKWPKSPWWVHVAGRVRGATHVTALVGWLPCCLSKFQACLSTAAVVQNSTPCSTCERKIHVPTFHKRAVNVFESWAIIFFWIFFKMVMFFSKYGYNFLFKIYY